MNNKKYWQSFGDLSNSEAHQQGAEKEFKEELLPLEALDGKGLLDAKTPRRDFLKYLGFSTAAATLAASCEMPVRRAVPYLNRPQDITPGIANYFASTYINEGEVVPVVVKAREGRPIKIEGNKLSPLTGGGTSAMSQASVLDLYDPTRLRHPLQKDKTGFKEIPTFDMVDQFITEGVNALAGKQLVLLTSTINSPSTIEIINNFLSKIPNSRHVQYDAVSYSGMLLANEASYGKRALPAYQFDKAKVIVSLGADFLGTWISPVEFAYQYGKNRKVNGSTNPQLSRHIQFESMMSMTGSNADDRYNHKPSETGAIASALLAKVGGGASALNNPALNKAVDDTAALLNANKGAALVVCGSNDANIQMVVNAINEAIGANGTTINWAATNNTKKGIDADMVRLATDIANGTVGGLMLYGCNPVYSYTDGKKLSDDIAKLPFSISFNSTMDETTENCKYIIPSNHWLESWGDAEGVTGNVTMIQPIINTLFKTRPFQSSLLKIANGISSPRTVVSSDTAGAAPVIATSGSIAGNLNEYENYFKQYWTSKLGASGYEKALQDGIVMGASFPQLTGGGTYSNARLAEAAGKLGGAKAGNYEVVFYQKVGMGSGSQANNPWLQELPDPVSKVTWDNYAMVSPALAKAILGLDVINNQRQADAYEVTPEKPMLKITINGKALELPAVIVPGVNNNTIAIALGYGRSSKDTNQSKERIGMAANGAGKNVFPFVSFDGASMIYSAPATVEKSKLDDYKIAQTQVHGWTENRPVVYETTLKKFVADPKEVLSHARHEREIIMPEGKSDYRKDATIYPDYVKPGAKWGMSIDLNSCTGCSACVIACTAENNVPVVGKTEVARAHEMHWLRIDRYFTGSHDNPDVVFQPMLCQHCDNAPCENVCPVAATNHSSEGLNQMTYNRCIGTRYCANNCPYKVRRFNWLDYTGSDSFPNNQKPLQGGYLDDAVFQMNDDLPRMVLNPDVTIRSRGVIEKCSFCVQRLQDRKLEAKKHGDASLIRNIETACSQACPTKAITFGNVNDPASEVSIARNDDNRNFYVMEQLHVLPNVSYLAKVRNTDRVLGGHDEGHDEKPAGKPAEASH